MSPPIQKLTYPQTEVIEILIEAAELISGHSLDLEELLRALRELVRKVVDYQVFAVLLKTADGRVLQIRSSVGYRPEVVPVIQRHGKGSLRQLLEAVFKGINSFTKGGQAEDDRTMIVVKAA